MFVSTEKKTREVCYEAPRALSFPVEIARCLLASGDPPTGGGGTNEDLGDDEDLPFDD